MQLNNLGPLIEEISREKNLSKEKILEAIEHALAVAYRKDFGEKNQNIKVKLDLTTGKIEVFDLKTVVENIPSEKTKGVEKLKEERKFNPKKEIPLAEAKKIKKDAKIGDEIKTILPVPSGFGRVAAQAAKQVITQKLREAEKEVIYQEFKEKEGKVVFGIVQRKEKGNILVDLEKATAILPPHEQIEKEKYLPGQRIRIYILEVKRARQGPEIIVSHIHPEILRELFKIEIPEIANGTVEIKSIAREAGTRAKVAVATKEENLDPIGTCIGQRGSRIQTIIAEIGGEKIDIVEYSENPSKFIINALSPAKISSIKIIDKEKKIARVKVKPDQLSLAIGKNGQNVRLASKLTGWKIEIEEETETKINNK
ncbi:MAG: transcription termination factor NusA [Patescibacteria group bacterium]